MRRKFLYALSAMLLLAGLCVMCFPSYRTIKMKAEGLREFVGVESYRAEYAAEQSQSEPSQSLSPEPGAEPEDPTTATEAPNFESKQFLSLWDACVAYNEMLAETAQAGLSAETMREPALRLSDYGWKQDAFGYLSIPEAGIKTPVYLGGSLANLDKGGAHLGETSLPIGGDNTHAVIAGHRSWSGAIVFRGIENLKAGDLVYITNPWETLTYEVVTTRIIWPDNTDAIRIQQGEDLLSIFTCTYPNTRRVLVTCTRIK